MRSNSLCCMSLVTFAGFYIEDNPFTYISCTMFLRKMNQCGGQRRFLAHEKIYQDDAKCNGCEILHKIQQANYSTGTTWTINKWSFHIRRNANRQKYQYEKEGKTTDQQKSNDGVVSKRQIVLREYSIRRKNRYPSIRIHKAEEPKLNAKAWEQGLRAMSPSHLKPRENNRRRHMPRKTS